MTAERDFDELAGRIEGLGRAVLIIATTLEQQGAVSAQSLQARWRWHSDALEPSLDVAQRTLRELADQLLVLSQRRGADGRCVRLVA